MYRSLFLSAACLLACGALASSALLAQTQEATPTASTAVYSSQGSLEGVTFTVTRLKRNTNGTVTLSVKLQGTPGKAVTSKGIGFSGETPWHEDYKLLDLANKKRYFMLEDSNGNCLCTHLTAQEISELNSGKPRDINIKFPAPPDGVKSIVVELPHAEPIDDVPITN